MFLFTISGITTGSSSLVKHVSAGTLTSVTNFASSVSRNLDRLSLDLEHFQRNTYLVPHLKALISSQNFWGGQRCGSNMSL